MNDHTTNPTMTSKTRRQALLLLGATTLLGAGALSRVKQDASGSSDLAATPEGTPSSAGTAVASPIAAYQIAMTNQLRFEPNEITIVTGETVRWMNLSLMPHTATGDPEQNPLQETNPEYVTLPEGADPWGSPLLQPGEQFEHQFTVPGRYEYFCIPHVLSGMRGAIIVEDPE